MDGDHKDGFLSDICRGFVKDPTQELEIRVQIDDDLFSDLYNRIINTEIENLSIDSSSIQQSISILISDKKTFSSKRHEIFFKDGKKQSETFINKESNLKPLKGPWYKISLAKERKIDSFNINNATMIRVKLRSQLYLKYPLKKFLKNWAFHFTFVNELNSENDSQKNSFSKLESIKEQMFVKTTPKTFTNILQSNIQGIIKPELEIEYNGPKNINMNDLMSEIKEILELVKIWIHPSYENVVEYQSEIYSIAQKLIKDQFKLKNFKSRDGLKNLINQPMQLTVESFNDDLLPNIDEYYLSDKIDGERVLMKISNDTSNKCEFKIIHSDKVTDLSKLVNKPNKLPKLTIIDAEYILSKSESKKSPKIHKLFIFDILYNDGVKVSQLPFSERETLLENAASIIAKYTDVKCEKKIMIKLSKDEKSKNYFRKQILKIYNRKTNAIDIDGLIFTQGNAALNNSNTSNNNSNNSNNSNNDDYFDMKVYKFKEPEQSTIDFLILKPPPNIIGKKPYLPKKDHEIYFLFCGIKKWLQDKLNLSYINDYRNIIAGINIKSDIHPIQFSPSSNPNAYIYYHPISDKSNKENLHGHIGEFIGYQPKSNEDDEEESTENINIVPWRLVKMRTDKDVDVQRGVQFGNSYRTAESTYDSYSHPLTLDMMTKGNLVEDIGYWKGTKSKIYMPSTKFNLFVKSQILKQIENKNWILDIGSGKGQDLFTYDCLNIKNGIFMDIDLGALTELNRRKYSLGDAKFYSFCKPPQEHIKVFTIEADATQPFTETLKKLQNINSPIDFTGEAKGEKTGMDAVVINLAIHYMIWDKESLDNIFNMVNRVLRPGGVFIFTCFDGTRVFDLLKKIQYKKSWDIHQETVLKYSIKKLYKGDKCADFGMKIGVVHPFSKGEYYEENLINPERIIKEFTKKGYKLHQNSSFGDQIEKFKQFDKRFGSLLSDDDMTYVSLYSYISLHKN